MKKLVVLLFAVAFFATSMKAQDSEQRTNSISLGIYSGSFTAGLAKECYPDIGILDLSFVMQSDIEWFSWGGFIRQFGAAGTTWTTGGASSSEIDMSIFSWGPEAHIEFVNNLYFVTRVGFLKAEEEWDGETFSRKGNHVDLGVKYELPIGDKFGLFAKTEYSIVTLKGDTNFGLDAWIYGAGCLIRF